MSKLPVAALCPYQMPAIFLNQSNEVSNFHLNHMTLTLELRKSYKPSIRFCWNRTKGTHICVPSNTAILRLFPNGIYCVSSKSVKSSTSAMSASIREYFRNSTWSAASSSRKITRSDSRSKSPARLFRCHFAVKGRITWLRTTIATLVKLMQSGPCSLMTPLVIPNSE
jgi:hypothetical protein